MPISSRFVVTSTILLLGVGLLTLVGIVGTTIWLGERARVYFTLVTEARTLRAAAVELRSALQNAESSQRGFLVSGNEIYLAPYDSATLQAGRHLETLTTALAGDPEAAPMVRRLTAVVADKIREMNDTIALKSNLRDAEAMAMLRTNRGKALMDEANVFLSGVVRSAEERLAEGIAEQRENASMLRWVSIVGGLVIILVVAGFALTVLRYAQESAKARDEVRLLNTTLEDRVARRTADLALARDRAEVLLAEVNHRVANSLMLVGSLVRLQANALPDKSARAALDETQARILAISLVHKRLYSSGDVRYVELDEYLSGLLEHLETSMRAEGHGGIALRHQLEPLWLRTDASVNLGVIVAEWVTNAFKYAYPEGTGEVRIRLTRLDEGRGELTVEDDGVGRKEDSPAKGTGIGTRVVKGIAQNMRAEVRYLARQPGMAAQLIFPLSLD
ncbi:MAG: CHASE3 domain-containing protein [Reyranella sp.]|nr:CHASE3 domain-containing protein [Reyranella sp.]